MTATKRLAAPAGGKGPQQDRSRATVDRILAAACTLLEECGHNDFTLGQVSQRTGVSIGAIYGHFAGKQELVRAVQLRELTRIAHQYAESLAGLAEGSSTLGTVVARAVECLGTLFHRNAAILRALLARSPRDPAMRRVCKRFDAQVAAAFRNFLLAQRAEIRQSDPAAAIDSCFDAVYAAVLRYHVLGNAPDVHNRGGLKEFLVVLGRMTTLYLISGTAQPPKARINRKAT